MEKRRKEKKSKREKGEDFCAFESGLELAISDWSAPFDLPTFSRSSVIRHPSASSSLVRVNQTHHITIKSLHIPEESLLRLSSCWRKDLRSTPHGEVSSYSQRARLPPQAQDDSPPLPLPSIPPRHSNIPTNLRRNQSLPTTAAASSSLGQTSPLLRSSSLHPTSAFNPGKQPPPLPFLLPPNSSPKKPHAELLRDPSPQPNPSR